MSKLPRVTLALLIVLPLMLSGCRSNAPILIGFAGELTGTHSDLGVHGRNGLQLAVETINAAGGIGGRPLEVLIRNDEGTPEGALLADQALIDAGVVAIIGHMTSAQTVAALPFIAEQDIILLSPTTSTSILAGRDDNFYRVIPHNQQEALNLANHIVTEYDSPRVTAIYDTDNAAFTEVLWKTFVQAYHERGGMTITALPFSSCDEPDFAPLVAQLRATSPDAVLIIASALDTALIAQQVRLANWDTLLFSSGWAHTETLIQNGGRAVEGIEFVISHDANNQTARYLEFKARYEARFARTPNFAAAFSYDAILLLVAALEQTDGRAEGLPEALTGIHDLQGLTSTMTLDQYGDIIRAQYLSTVQDNQFITLATLQP